MHIFCTISDSIFCHLAGRRKNPGVATVGNLCFWNRKNCDFTYRYTKWCSKFSISVLQAFLKSSQPMEILWFNFWKEMHVRTRYANKTNDLKCSKTMILNQKGKFCWNRQLDFIDRFFKRIFQAEILTLDNCYATHLSWKNATIRTKDKGKFAGRQYQSFALKLTECFISCY